MTTYTLRSASPAKTRADAVVIGVVQGKDRAEVAPGGEDVAKAWGRKFAPMLAALGVKGKTGEITRIPTAGTITSPVLVLVGLGAPEADAGAGSVSTSTLRTAAGAAARAVPNAASVALALPASSAQDVRALTEGWLLGSYAFTTYQSSADLDRPGEVAVLSGSARKKDVVAAFEQAQVVAAAVAQARDWVNTPAGDLTPPVFADAVEQAGSGFVKEHASGRGTPKVAVTVWDEARLDKEGFGGHLGVGRGSAAPPRMVELSYAPKGATTHLALVGKGITFDSGGLSIKPAQGMHEMKSDMAGAAAVVAATLAIAALRLPVRVTTYAAMAENMISGEATRPGDVVTIYGGRTVEVQNTDAEGRLVLADALVKAGESDPDVLVDVATLTGAMVVALGDKVAGVMGVEEVVGDVLAAAERAGEQAWAMPIPEQMHDRVRSSKIADLSQVDWIRWGGGLYAAAFLREFTGGRAWAHVDIAGPSFTSGGATGHITPGGTGYAVATLVELARGLSGRS